MTFPASILRAWRTGDGIISLPRVGLGSVVPSTPSVIVGRAAVLTACCLEARDGPTAEHVLHFQALAHLAAVLLASSSMQVTGQ